MYSLPSQSSSVSTNYNIYSNPYRTSTTTSTSYSSRPTASSSNRSMTHPTHSSTYSTAKGTSNTNNYSNNAHLRSYSSDINNNSKYIESPGKFSKNRRFSLKSTSSSFSLPIHPSPTTASSSPLSSTKLTAAGAHNVSAPAARSIVESTKHDSEKSASKRNLSQTRKFDIYDVNSSATAASVNTSDYSSIPTKFSSMDASKDNQIDRREQYAMNNNPNTSSLSQLYYTNSIDKKASFSISAFPCMPSSSSVAPSSAAVLLSREVGNSNSNSSRKLSSTSKTMPSSSSSASKFDGFTHLMSSRKEPVSSASTVSLHYHPQAQTQQQQQQQPLLQSSYELSNSGVSNVTALSAQPEFIALNDSERVKTNSGNMTTPSSLRMNNNKNATSNTALIEQIFVKRLLQAHNVVDEMLRSRGMHTEDERLYLRHNQQQLKQQQKDADDGDEHKTETATTETQHGDNDARIEQHNDYVQHSNNDEDSSHSYGTSSSCHCLASSSAPNDVSKQHKHRQKRSSARRSERRCVSPDSDSGLSLDEDDSEEWMVHTVEEVVVEEGDGKHEHEQKRRTHKTNHNDSMNCSIQNLTGTTVIAESDYLCSLPYTENARNITIEITLVNRANKGKFEQQQQIASEFSIMSKIISNELATLNVKLEKKAKLKKKKVVKDLSENDKKIAILNENHGTLLEEKSRRDNDNNDDNIAKIQQIKRIQTIKISPKTKSSLTAKQQKKSPKDIKSSNEIATQQQRHKSIVQRTLNASLTDRRRQIVHSAAEISIQHVSFYQIASSLIKQQHQKCIAVEKFVRIHFRLTQRNPKSLSATIHVPLLKSFMRIATFDAKLPSTTTKQNRKKFRSQTIEIAQLQRRPLQTDTMSSDSYHQQQQQQSLLCAATLLRKTIPAHVRKSHAASAVANRVHIPETFLKPFNLSSTTEQSSSLSSCTLQQQAAYSDDDDEKKLRTARYQLKHIDFGRTVSCNSLLNTIETTAIAFSNSEKNIRKWAIRKEPETEKRNVNEDAIVIVAEDVAESEIRKKFSRTKAAVRKRQLETIKSGSVINDDHLCESNKNDDKEPRNLKGKKVTITNSTSSITSNSAKKDKLLDGKQNNAPLSKNTKKATRIPSSKSVVKNTNDNIIANNHINTTDYNNISTNNNTSNEANNKMLKSYEDGDLTKGSNATNEIHHNDVRRLRRGVTCINSDDLRKAFARMPNDEAATTNRATESANDQTLIYEFRRRKSIPVPQAIIRTELPSNLVAFSTPRILNVKPVRDFIEPLPPAKFLRRRTPERLLVTSDSVAMATATYNGVPSLARKLSSVNKNELVKSLSQKSDHLSNEQSNNVQKAMVITENVMKVSEMSSSNNNNNNSKKRSKPKLLPISAITDNNSSLHSQQQQERRQSSNIKENPFGVSLKRVNRKKQQPSINAKSITNNTTTRSSSTPSRKPTIPKWRQVERFSNQTAIRTPYQFSIDDYSNDTTTITNRSLQSLLH